MCYHFSSCSGVNENPVKCIRRDQVYVCAQVAGQAVEYYVAIVFEVPRITRWILEDGTSFCNEVAGNMQGITFADIINARRMIGLMGLHMLTFEDSPG